MFVGLSQNDSGSSSCRSTTEDLQQHRGVTRVKIGARAMQSALEVAADGVRIELKGRITAYTAAPIWRSALETLARHPDHPIIVDASQVEYADNVGIALLLDLIRRDRAATAKVEIHDLVQNLAALVHTFDPKNFAGAVRGRSSPGVFEHVGRATVQHLRYLTQMADFIGECWVELR